MVELFRKIIEVRDVAHQIHLNKSETQAKHEALQEFYESLVEIFDELVEVYQENESTRIKITCSESPFEGISYKVLIIQCC